MTQTSENVVEGIELTTNEIETSKEEEVVDLTQGENQEIQVTEEIAEKAIEIEVDIPSESIVDEEIVDSEESEVEEESSVEEEPVPLDLSGRSKAQLLDLVKEKINSPNALKSDKIIQEIKNSFDELSHKEREEALQQFLGEGGISDDFEFRSSPIDKEFNALVNDFKKQVYALRKEAEKQKEKNLVAKTELLNRLRELVDGEETTLSMAAVKAIQDSWKSIGPVPLSQSRNLWASFNALMDRFYDNRSIYFELKELDRKKNLESKLELCEKAESLVQLEDLKDAIQQLNELHEEFKHLGPVPREEQEQVWQRFKSASDAIYDRRKEFFEGQKDVIKKNLEEKEALILILTPFGEFKADRIKDWNSKTKEILELQKAWEKVGPLPKESSKEINKAFWSLFKQFFHNKNLFFKELDDIRATNQKKAEELIAKAQELQENTNWQTTANQFVKLQQDWKKLGPTPEKQRDALYKKFKEACDTFFENRRKSSKESNTEFELNLTKKLAIIDQIHALKSVDAGLDENQLSDLVNEFNALGFVPRKNIKEVQAKFKEAVDACLDALGEKGANKEDFLFRLNLNRLHSDPNSVKTLNKKEHGIRKQITDLENSITLWRNNLDFFAASKTADKLREQFDVKIQKAEEEIDKLKKKLTILKEF